jgi:hypothetical protein
MNITKQKLLKQLHNLNSPKPKSLIEDNKIIPTASINNPEAVKYPINSLIPTNEHQQLMPVVNSLMKSILKKNKDELQIEKIEPISDEVKFGINGIWLFIGRQGSGKSYKIMQTILYTELLHKDKPLFNNIIFSSTSNENDKTIDAFKHIIRTKIEYCPVENILQRIEEHIHHKKKFYSIMSYVQSKGKICNKVMKRLAIKHNLIDTRKTSLYIERKLRSWGYPTYPAFCLFILDDCMGNMELERKESPLVKLLTKCRHYNVTCIISQQSTKGIGRPTRRLASDACIWAGFGASDFMDLAREMGSSNDPKELFEIYKTLTGHSFMSFHTHLDQIVIEKIE